MHGRAEHGDAGGAPGARHPDVGRAAPLPRSRGGAAGDALPAVSGLLLRNPLVLGVPVSRVGGTDPGAASAGAGLSPCHLAAAGIQVWGLFAGEGAAADPLRNVLERCLTWGVLLGISPFRGSTFPGDPRPAAASPDHPPSLPRRSAAGACPHQRVASVAAGVFCTLGGGCTNTLCSSEVQQHCWNKLLCLPFSVVRCLFSSAFAAEPLIHFKTHFLLSFLLQEPSVQEQQV